jgi:hypothetical protein
LKERRNDEKREIREKKKEVNKHKKNGMEWLERMMERTE